MSTNIQLHILLEKTSSFLSFFKFAMESEKYLGERFDAYMVNYSNYSSMFDYNHFYTICHFNISFKFKFILDYAQVINNI